MATRILLIDDHQVLRESLRHLLNMQPGLEVIGEAGDGREAVKLAGELSPDVIVMDISMPGLNGLEATREIMRKNPNVRILALSMYNDERMVKDCIDAGASGYILKQSSFRELAHAVEQVAKKNVYIHPGIAGNPAAKVGMPEDVSQRVRNLSTREREVLQLMAEGRATKEIAHDLGVSVKTVETHRRQIMEKLGIYSVAELTKYAIRQGLTTV